MKPFTDYLIDMRPKYEFVVRVAGCDTVTEMQERVRAGLAMYVVESITAAKRLPIQEHKDFVGLGACEVHMFTVELKYPTITEQVASIVSNSLNISRKNVCVRTQREDAMHEAQVVEPKKAKDGQALVGNNRVESMLKQLETRRHEFAQKAEHARAPEAPQGHQSPVGSRQNKIPSIRGK
jgi:hypothetical protein